MRALLAAALVATTLGVAAAPASAQYFAFGKNRVQYDAPAWRYVQSTHLDVYFYERGGTAPSGRVLATFAAEAAEEAYGEIATLFNYDVQRRVAILVYPSHNDFAVTNAVDLPDYAEGIGGVTELYQNRIAVPFTGDWRDFRRVLHHELVHAVVNDVFYGGSVQSLLQRGLRFPIPLWFNEGLAEYSAQGWDTNSDMYVRDAVLADRLAPIQRLDGYFAYRGGQGVWDWIAHEYGREKVTEILERVRLQRSVGGAFRRATGLSLPELSERWHRTLKAVYYPEVAAREAIRDVGRPIATRRVGGAGYHATPVVSPQGDRVAYVATRDGLFDVMVAETAGAPRPRKLLDAQDSRRFESLRILSPGLAWSPDGQRLAVAVKNGRTDAVELVDVATGQSETLRPVGVDAIRAVAWSPDGAALALSATAGALSDVWTVDLATGATVNLTGDLYADLAPAWSPDGRWIAFHSDRGDAAPRAATPAAAADGRVDLAALGRGAYDLFRIEVATGRVERLTDDAVWDQTHARYAAAPPPPEAPPAPRELPAPATFDAPDSLAAAGPEAHARADSARAAAGPPMPPGSELPGSELPGPRLAPDTARVAADPLAATLPTAAPERPDDGPELAAHSPGPTAHSPGPTAHSPGPTAHSPTLVFLSDANGIPNLYALDGGAPRPLTDIQTGLTDVSVSADGSRAAVLALDEGTPSVYLLRDPLRRRDAPGALAPTVWAARRTGAAAEATPSLQIAAAGVRERNPLLRDAADGAPPPPAPTRGGPDRRPDLARYSPEELDRAGFPADADLDSLLAALGVGPPPPAPLVASADTAAVDFRTYEFSAAFDEAAAERFERAEDAFRPVGNRDADGRLRVRRYRLRFSPDLVYAAGAYDTVFGVQSVTQMLFSDVTGDHRLALATNLVLDLRNSDYLLRYEHRPGRLDWSLQAFHLARELPDFSDATVYRYRNFGATASASYPLDKFRRVDAEVGVLGVSLADLSDLGTRARTRAFVYPRLSYTADATVPGFLGPRSGARWAASVAGSPGPDVLFATALADGRRYWTLGPGYAVAARVSAGASVGPDPQRFYAAGVQNWLNPTFRSLPVGSADDFVFATPVLPLRGFGYSEAEGDRFALANVEARMPLVAAILPGPLPVLPLYNLQAVGFVDAGVIALGGLDVWREIPAETDPETGAELAPASRELDDVLLGTGVGLRTVVLGYPVRVDWAWPFDGAGFGERRLYFSVGLDF